MGRAGGKAGMGTAGMGTAGRVDGKVRSNGLSERARKARVNGREMVIEGLQSEMQCRDRFA